MDSGGYSDARESFVASVEIIDSVLQTTDYMLRNRNHKGEAEGITLCESLKGARIC